MFERHPLFCRPQFCIHSPWTPLLSPANTLIPRWRLAISSLFILLHLNTRSPQLNLAAFPDSFLHDTIFSHVFRARPPKFLMGIFTRHGFVPPIVPVNKKLEKNLATPPLLSRPINNFPFGAPPFPRPLSTLWFPPITFFS